MTDIQPRAFDRTIIAGAASRKSLKEISKDLGGKISPEQVGVELEKLLNSTDYLSEAQEQRLLFLDMMRLKDLLFERAQGFGEEAAASYGPLVRMLKLLDDTMQRVNNVVDDKVLRIQRAHADVMIQAINLTAEKMLFELHKRYPEVEREELQEILQMSLPAAVSSIESNLSNG